MGARLFPKTFSNNGNGDAYDVTEFVSQQRDNFRFGQSKNFRFLENRVRFFFVKTSKENRHERGSYHVEQKRD